MKSNNCPLSSNSLKCFWAFTGICFSFVFAFIVFVSRSHLHSLVFVFYHWSCTWLLLPFFKAYSKLGGNTRPVSKDLIVFITHVLIQHTCHADYHLQRQNEEFLWLLECKQSCIRGTKSNHCAFQRSSHRCQAVWFKWTGPKCGTLALVTVIPIATKAAFTRIHFRSNRILFFPF